MNTENLVSIYHNLHLATVPFAPFQYVPVLVFLSMIVLLPTLFMAKRVIVIVLVGFTSICVMAGATLQNPSNILSNKDNGRLLASCIAAHNYIHSIDFPVGLKSDPAVAYKTLHLFSRYCGAPLADLDGKRP